VSAALPPISSLVPHAGPMLLLRRVIDHGPERTRCEARASDASILADADGRLPALACLEHMAQCVAVHGGLLARAHEEPPRPGLLLGTRRLRLEVDDLGPDERLLVSASPYRARPVGMSAFDCRVESADTGGLVAEARLNIYVAESLEALVQGGAA